ncbi:MAG: paraquat-inducible membrane protein A [Epsilonproteobacteria bacterium]|nr:paraquat-inducible membrane protein A [Campylobacterota bacterium]NPA64977.1 paraquat-inducible membrane protein A [Campylobacterota bacterium]
MRLVRCPLCGATNYEHSRCYRCSSWVDLDKKGSLSKAIAFLIAALIFYIPANIYPILKTAQFADTKGSTIIEGVIELWHSGDYPVALIILFASVMIPILKFLILIYLIIAIAKGSCKGVEQKVRLYHLIEVTGPWSLIDVFVVVILVALIHFHSVAIVPGPGATSFALMVLLTLLASKSLDPRLIGEDCGK